MKTRFQLDLAEEREELVAAVRKLGLHRSNLSRWRRGLQGVGVETAQSMQQELARAGVAVDLDYFFAPAPDQSIGGREHGA